MHIPADMLKNTENVWFSNAEPPFIVSRENRNYLCREMKSERRKDRRFNVEDGHYLVIDSYAPQICTILNVCSGGISYTYYRQKDQQVESEGTFDILIKGNGFCLENIPYTKVADYTAPDNTGAGNVEKRVACIHFDSLSDKQSFEVNRYIVNYIDKNMN